MSSDSEDNSDFEDVEENVEFSDTSGDDENSEDDISGDDDTSRDDDNDLEDDTSEDDDSDKPKKIRRQETEDDESSGDEDDDFEEDESSNPDVTVHPKISKEKIDITALFERANEEKMQRVRELESKQTRVYAGPSNKERVKRVVEKPVREHGETQFVFSVRSDIYRRLDKMGIPDPDIMAYKITNYLVKSVEYSSTEMTTINKIVSKLESRSSRSR